MPASAVEVIAGYLKEAISAEKGFETELRASAKNGDDSEVQTSFERAASKCLRRIEILGSRLEALNGTYRDGKSLLAEVLAMAPKAAQIGHIPEERLAQNLIAGFSMGKSGRAMYQALRSAALSAGDERTAELAGELGEEQENTAQEFWHFIPSRSKIAFNVLTAGEVDPAIETRSPGDRLSDTNL